MKKMPFIYKNIAKRNVKKSETEEIYPDRYKKKMLNFDEILIQHNSILRRSFLGKVTNDYDMKNNTNVPTMKERMMFYTGFRNNRNVSSSLQINQS